MCVDEARDSSEQLSLYIKDIQKSKHYRGSLNFGKGISCIKRGRFFSLFKSMYAALFCGWIDEDTRRESWKKYLDLRSKEVIPELDESSSITLYSCVLGGYDDLKPPLRVAGSNNVRSVLFTDDLSVDVPGWEVKTIPAECAELGPRLANRYVKLHPHEFFDTDFSLYVDGSIWLTENPRAFCASASSSKAGFAAFAHGLRDNIEDESKVCFLLGKGDRDGIKRQVDHANQLGLMEMPALFEAGILATDLSNPIAADLYQQWWNELVEYGSQRDQLCLPCALKQCGLWVDDIGILGSDMSSDARVVKREHLLL